MSSWYSVCSPAKYFTSCSNRCAWLASAVTIKTRPGVASISLAIAIAGELPCNSCQVRSLFAAGGKGGLNTDALVMTTQLVWKNVGIIPKSIRIWMTGCRFVFLRGVVWNAL